MSELIKKAKEAVVSNDPKVAKEVVSIVDKALADKVGIIVETLDNAMLVACESLEELESVRDAQTSKTWKSLIDSMTDDGYKHVMGMDKIINTGRQLYRKEDDK